MATVISIVSISIALVALAVNVSGLARRPRIVAEWGWVQESPPYEGLSIIVTARRRTVEIDDVGGSSFRNGPGGAVRPSG